MTEEIISQKVLQQKLDTIQLSITKRQRLYYHIDAIANFIYHLNNLPSERTRARVANNIDDYLIMLQSKIPLEHDLTDLGKELSPYIWKIGGIYKNELGFIGKPYYPFKIAFWIILFFVFQYAYSTMVALGIVVAIVIGTLIYEQPKIKARKYF